MRFILIQPHGTISHDTTRPNEHKLHRNEPSSRRKLLYTKSKRIKMKTFAMSVLNYSTYVKYGQPTNSAPKQYNKSERSSNDYNFKAFVVF